MITMREIEEKDMIDEIRFVKGKFIVRDISLLDGTKSIHCRNNTALRGVSGE